jgi:hypothetical protein
VYVVVGGGMTGGGGGGRGGATGMQVRARVGSSMIEFDPAVLGWVVVGMQAPCRHNSLSAAFRGPGLHMCVCVCVGWGWGVGGTQVKACVGVSKVGGECG